jgi:D-glycero-beta-D-manno-heptose 1-phosphate adenylyltransferase
MNSHLSLIQRKIINQAVDFSFWVEEFKSQNKKITFTNGCFDILHRGHIEYLSKAADLADVLIVGLNTDSSVKKIKGKNRPIQNQESRALILSALFFVDKIILFDEETPLNLIKKIVPDFLVKGGDYKIENIVGADFVTSRGGKVVTIPFLDGFSSSSIINAI